MRTRAICILTSPVSATQEIVSAFIGSEGFDEGSDSLPEVLNGPFCGFAEQCFQLREGFLNRIEIR